MASCSITTGMCLEWVWYVADTKTNDCAYCSCKYYSKMLKNVLYLGAMVSAGPAAFAASLTGLKTVLFTGMSATALGSAVITYSEEFSLPWLCVGRMLHGLGAGTVFVIVPNYASELSKSKTRSKHFTQYNTPTIILIFRFRYYTFGWCGRESWNALRRDDSLVSFSETFSTRYELIIKTP